MDTLPWTVVDAHTHIGRLPRHVHHTYSVADLVRALDAEGVRFALCSSASSMTVSQAYGTREMLDAAAAYPDRLGTMIWIRPRDPAWREDAERAVAERRVYGIKLHPRLDFYAVDYESLADVWEFARETRLPIVTDTSDAQEGIFAAERYAPLLERFHEVTLVLFHFNIGRPLGGIVTAKRYPNAYVDTCGVPPEAIEVGLDVLGPERILFGTDAPIGWDLGRPYPPGLQRPLRTYRQQIEPLRKLIPSEADLARVLAGNAVRLFGISL